MSPEIPAPFEFLRLKSSIASIALYYDDLVLGTHFGGVHWCGELI